MNPTVAVVAQGAMGAGVGARLVERGLRSSPRSTGRSEDSAKRAKAAGMVAVSDQEMAQRRLLPLHPAAERRAGAGRADGGGDRARQPQAGLCRLQRGEPADQDRDRPCHHPGRLAVRRCRHHRRAAEGRATTGPASMRPGPDAGRFASLDRFRACRPRHERADRRRLGDEDVLRRHHQGLHRAWRHDDAGGGARRRRRRIAGGAGAQPAGVCCRGCSARSRRCTPRPIASSARWRRSPITSARTSRRRRCSTPSPISIRGSPPTTTAAGETGALTTFLKPKQKLLRHSGTAKR